MPGNTGFRPPDALDLWAAIMDGSAGPRTEVVHQVQNQWSCDVTQPGGGCASSMRMGEMKLIIGGPGDSRTVEKPAPCIITPPPPPGYAAPCPTRGFVEGCEFHCGAAFQNCQACFGNATGKPVFTDTAAACQAKCAGSKGCAAFQWVGVGSSQTHHQCIFKCPGAIAPGRTECVIGLKTGEPGSSMVCGPAHNDSSASPPPGPPPPSPGPPPPMCPVPFGLTTGQVEPGTDHARADGLKGTITELKCDPWCLFNLTDDVGERNDLGQNPVYQEIAQKIAARLKYHGSTGPMPAYIWALPEQKPELDDALNTMCLNALATGFAEPVDLGNDKKLVTLLD